MFHRKHANAIHAVLQNLEDSMDDPAAVSDFDLLTPDDVVALFTCMNEHYEADKLKQASWDWYPNLAAFTKEERDETS